MAYTTPLKVFRTIGRTEASKETFTGVSNGDTVTLTNNYIIENTETITLDGSSVADGDYTVDLENNQVTYTGAGSGELEVDYLFGPYSSATVNDKIDSAVDYIEDFTNTTFDGVGTVTDEYYDGGGREQNVYVFRKRPVQTVVEVAVNQNTASSANPNYKVLTEGLGEDFVKKSTLGVKFLDYGTQPDSSPRDLRVTYKYGYESVPSDLKSAAAEMVVDDLIRGTVSGAMVDGRDNFDPQTVNVQSKEWRGVLKRYKVERMSDFTVLAEKGSIN